MFEPGSVVVIPFLYSDLAANKKRSVLALTTPDALGDFLAMPLTSQPQVGEDVRRECVRRLSQHLQPEH